MKILINFLIFGVSFAWTVPMYEKIINGYPAQPGQLPWQVALYKNVATGVIFCGGALISDQWVLTAAHCASDALSFTIILGTTDSQGTNGQVLQTDTSIIHPEYDVSRLSNDIALIKLPGPVTFSNAIQPIDLSEDYLDSGIQVLVSGWGTTSDGTSSITDDLNYVWLTTITNADCFQVYDIVTEETVCTTGHRQSTCLGDSGGALVTFSEGKALHQAIVSFVHHEGCESGAPAGYTRTSFHRDWIRENSGV